MLVKIVNMPNDLLKEMRTQWGLGSYKIIIIIFGKKLMSWITVTVTSLPSNIDVVSSSDKFSLLWQKHCYNFFNCVKSNGFMWVT